MLLQIAKLHSFLCWVICAAIHGVTKSQTQLSDWTELNWIFHIVCSVAQSYLTLSNSVDCNQPGSSIHGIFQARILEWLPFRPPEYLPNPGIKPMSPETSALQADSFPLSHLENQCTITCVYTHYILIHSSVDGWTFRLLPYLCHCK